MQRKKDVSKGRERDPLEGKKPEVRRGGEEISRVW